MMALAFAPTLYTVAEYLTLERKAEERHEYLDGYIYKMAGESEEHADICANLSGFLHPQLRGTPCRSRIANTKVRSGPLPLSPRSSKGLFSYPDVFVVCDPIQYHDEFRDIVINQVVIFEVLSPSTEEFDRDIKFEWYDRWNPSCRIICWSRKTRRRSNITRAKQMAVGAIAFTAVLKQVLPSSPLIAA
jgi:Uma2 family endonuclease